MAKFQYKTTPDLTDKAPAGIWHILTNECAERFAYYGMTFILFTFMTEYLLGPSGHKMPMNSSDAKSYYHLFKAANYAFPIIGALMSDIWLGKFRTILWFSVLYCIGFIFLMVDQTRSGLFIGLFLIALASGIIKPCVTANVGDQFGQKNKHLMTKIYNWFYFAINLGAYVGPFLTPLLLYNENFGPRWAFGLTAVAMIIATVAFWLGRKRYVHAKPAGISFVKKCFSETGMKSVLNLAGLYVFIAMFWGLFEQTGSSWIEQAKNMDLHFIIDWKADQIPSSQALFVMAMIPLFSYVVYPVINKIVKLTPLRKIGIGMVITASAFIIIIWIAFQLNGGFIANITSATEQAGFAPVNLVDNDPNTCWASAEEPNQANPQQILIQLRENKDWDVSRVEITLAGELSKREVTAVIKKNDKLIKKTKGKIKNANDINEIVNIARQAYTAIYDSIKQLEADNYHPRDISAHLAAAGAQTPKLITELKYEQEDLKYKLEKYQDRELNGKKLAKFERLNEDFSSVTKKIEDYEGYLADCGFKFAGNITVDGTEDKYSIQFETFAAAHVLLNVKSNYGADKIRLAEVGVLTEGPLPAGFDKKDSIVWPNVAAIGFQPNVAWHFLGNIILTVAELLVSVTSLEFMYSQAPAQMKSFIMSIYLLAISLGNVYATIFNKLVKNTRFESGPGYFILWVVLMLIATAVFVVGSIFYKGKTHTIDEDKQGGSAEGEPEKGAQTG